MSSPIPGEPYLVQSAGNEIATNQSYQCRVTLNTPTTENNLVVVIATISDDDARLTGPSGFTSIREREQGEFKIAMWYRQASPAMSSITIGASRKRAMMVRVLEYGYIHQSAALDKFVAVSSRSNFCRSGSLAVAQDDSLVLGIIANRTASCGQSGFTGQLVRISDNVTPLRFGDYYTDTDDRRHRLTVHQGVTTSITTVGITGRLSSYRDWIVFLAIFRGGSAGPKRMTSRTAGGMGVRHGGIGGLTAFGPLRSTDRTVNVPLSAGVNNIARIGPYDYQYRLGGFTGLLIGDSTDYRVENVEGLEGWNLRTSDDELPRGDGALRGVDLQSARIITFKMAFSGTHEDIEEKADVLYRALIPQRDTDWPLIWRHAGRGLRIVYCRPTDLSREVSQRQLMKHEQSFALRAADPRHYSVVEYNARIGVTPATSVDPALTPLINLGNSPAYPIIRINGPTSGADVTRVELRNETTDTVFDVTTTLATGSTLVGDMPARATGAPRSIVTVDGASKYGAWQFPREAFRLNPGGNDIYLRTTPAGAPVACTLTYRDTWSG
jgi:hypothetical protein